MLAASCETGAPREDGDAGVARDAGQVPVACLEAAGHSDLGWIQEHVFTPGCAGFTSCHQGGSPDDLDLRAGHSETSLVNVRSRLWPTWLLVTPGHPEQSYLMVALGWSGAVGPLCPSGTMPDDARLLCDPEKDAIARWIEDLSDAGPPEAVSLDAGNHCAATGTP